MATVSRLLASAMCFVAIAALLLSIAVLLLVLASASILPTISKRKPGYRGYMYWKIRGILRFPGQKRVVLALLVVLVYTLSCTILMVGPHVVESTFFWSDETRAKELMGLLACLAPILDKHKITWFIDSGTLLGSVRNNRIITGDEDIDLAVIRTSKLDGQLELAMAEVNARNGHCANTMMVMRGKPDFIGQWYMPLDSFRSIKRAEARLFALHPFIGLAMPVYIDIPDFNIDVIDNIIWDDDYVDAGNTPFLSIDSVLPLKECKLYDKLFKCPAKPAEVLEREYGSDWQIPKRGFHTYMLDGKSRGATD